MQERIKEYLDQGGNVFISGAYIASDLFLNKPSDHTDKSFATDLLRYKLETNHSVKIGKVYSVDNNIFPETISFSFNTELNNKIYVLLLLNHLQMPMLFQRVFEVRLNVHYYMVLTIWLNEQKGLQPMYWNYHLP